MSGRSRSTTYSSGLGAGGIGSSSSVAGGAASGGVIGPSGLGVVDLHRLAVEIRIGEMAGRSPEIDQGEIELSCVSSWTRVPRPTICLNSVIEPTSPVKHDQPASLRIDTGRQQAARWLREPDISGFRDQ